MKYVKIFLTILLLICLIGCNSDVALNAENLNATGSNYMSEMLPQISSFSGEKYENFELHFAEIESVTLYAEEGIKTISPTDERVIRLLNFIAYSMNEQTHAYITSLIENEEIALWHEYKPRLEINFKRTGMSDGVLSDQKILIWGNSFLSFQDPTNYKEYESPVAERYWPYLSLYHPTEKLGSKEDQLFPEKSGVEPWIDLLAYASFS